MIFEDFSSFRIISFIIAVISIFILILNFRKSNLTVGDYVIWFSVAAILILLSLYPSIIYIFTNFISLSFNERYDRLFVLSYIFVFLGLALIFYYRLKINLLRFQFIEMMLVNETNKFIGMYKSGSKSLIVSIPAYNEMYNIKNIINRIPKKICGLSPFILVISDGSTDKTYENAKRTRARVLQLPINLGQCVAYRIAYKIAIRLKFKYFVHLDADGQYNPEEMNKLVKPLISGKINFVSGSRIMGRYEEKLDIKKSIRTLGLYFFNFVLTVLLKKKITDSASGFRSITVDLLSKLKFKQEQFHSSELLIEAIGKKANFIEVPITFNKRESGNSKKPNFIKYGFGFSNTIMRTWFRIR